MSYLASCAAMPNDGPLYNKVTSQSESKDDFVYGLVSLNATTAKALKKHDYYPLSSGFNSKRRAPGTKIGPGDILDVTIFEAGPDGIFSTPEKKSVDLKLTVQGDGRISIPFDGTVKVTGRSLEQIRSSIKEQLKGRAVEPDVLVNVAEVRSQTVVVNGSVHAAKTVPLLNGRERLLDVIGEAGGPSEAPYDTYVSVSRGETTRTALLQTLIDYPKENIHVWPKDSIFLSHDPRTFTAFGAVDKKGRHKFETAHLNLIDAAGIAGGLDSNRANPKAYFVFRYEYEHVIRHLCDLGELDLDALEDVINNPDILDEKGRLPIVYQVDLSDPDNFFTSKRFPVRSGDIIYVSRSPISDFTRFLAVISDGTSVVRAF